MISKAIFDRTRCAGTCDNEDLQKNCRWGKSITERVKRSIMMTKKKLLNESLNWFHKVCILSKIQTEMYYGEKCVLIGDQPQLNANNFLKFRKSSKALQ